MSQKNTHNGLENKLGGDVTSGPISLSEITAVNPSFMNLIGATQPPPAVPNEESQSPVKRNPEDIAKQLNIAEKRRPLLNSQETIETLRNENLKLKLKIHNMKHSSNKEILNFNTDSIERDLVTDFMNQNEELRRQIEERDRKERNEELRKKKMHRDAVCQTNLDSLNIEELFEANATLKRMREQQKLPHATSHHHNLHQSSQPQRQDKQTQQPIVSQLHYPSVTLPKQVVAAKDSMDTDEKAILNGFYKVNGQLTTLKCLLEAASDTG